MKQMKNFTLIGLIFIAVLSVQAQNSAVQTKADVVYLSSDYLEGRKTGTAGEVMAAEYIAFRFKELGMSPKGDSSWYQFFPFSSNPHVKASESEVKGRNVIGFIDNNRKKTIVIGGHYDHLGHGGFGSLHAGEEAIHNGADDNASGIAAMMDIAYKLRTTRKKQQYNFLFIAFSGEEFGLIGSKYFVENPTIDLSTVNYMLNFDMVGMLDEEKNLIINGVGTSPLWKKAIESANSSLKITTTESGIGASDHTSFYLKEIPSVHFFTGQHKFYHKPEDDAHLVNFDGIIEVSDYVVALIEYLDSMGDLPFTKTKDEEERSVAKFKVTLGVMPDYVYEGDGMRIDAVINGRPAEKAGITDGDIVVKMGDTEVTDIYSYMEALSSFTAGQSADVTVERDGKKQTFTVTF